ncbi:MAG TPA: NAD-dependent epimerase/dehydratase family protein, partial [Flavihumibacter sp.]
MIQVILGAGGDIGRLLARELKQYSPKIRLVARNPHQVNGDDELFPADLRNATLVNQSLEGASVAYLTAGLKYDLRVWRKDWPIIMQNVIDACLHHKVKLVFFDNVYAYSKNAIPHMTEESPMDPPSQKGRVRYQLLQMIDQAIRNKGLQALIARSADFYGPGSKNGILNTLVLDPLLKNKKPSWQADINKIHAFTYTPDAARATAMLGNTDTAYNQVWHLPTSNERWTGADFIQKASALVGKQPAYTLLSPFMLKLAGLFNRTIKELVEMQYQNNQDYFFDSSK